MSQMLYKKGSMYDHRFLTDGQWVEVSFDYIIVEESEVEDQLKKGWFLTVEDALIGFTESSTDSFHESGSTIDSEPKRRGRPSGINKETNT